MPRRAEEPSPWRARAGWGLGLLLLAGIGGWALSGDSVDPPAPAAASAASMSPTPVASASDPALSPPARAGGPYTAAAEQARIEAQARWQERLEHAEAALQRYRDSTRYPPTSQPLSRHADQAYPRRPIVEEHPLVGTGGSSSTGVKLRTSQERVFVQGDESVAFSVALHDEAGHALPLRIVRASAREMPAPNTASTHPVVSMPFNDDGIHGDIAAGDGIYGARLRPGAEGFAGLAGQIRVELIVQSRDQEGPVFFDVFYTPATPATWQGGVREVLEEGALNFDLGLQVQEPGRYVVTGRVDDASGTPFALLTFNEELGAGRQNVRLTLFGRLVRDARPAFPLTLRDVEGFLLRPDAFPDRSLLPSLPGAVHKSQEHPLASFGSAEWEGEQRERYLGELGRDVSRAQEQIKRFASRP